MPPDGKPRSPDAITSTAAQTGRRSRPTVGGAVAGVHAIRTWVETVAVDIAAARAVFDRQQTPVDDVPASPLSTSHRAAATVH
jgi:hypothetical protein